MVSCPVSTTFSPSRSWVRRIWPAPTGGWTLSLRLSDFPRDLCRVSRSVHRARASQSFLGTEEISATSVVRRLVDAMHNHSRSNLPDSWLTARLFNRVSCSTTRTRTRIGNLITITNDWGLDTEAHPKTAFKFCFRSARQM